MKRYAVIGWPVKHSRSPLMHNAAFKSLGLDARYDAIAIEPDALHDTLDTAELDGFNVTLPHKLAVMDWVDEVDSVAEAIGAVNTVYRVDDRWVGTNTDSLGLRRSLEEAGVEIAGCNAVVLGAGGAARAAVHALRDASVHIAARRFAAAREIGTALDWTDLGDVFPRTDLVIQATSATLGDEARAFAEALPLDALPKHATVCDLVYTPRHTTVLQCAENQGLRIVDGTGMLVHQGAAALELWTGRNAPVEVMRGALLASLA